MPAFSRAALLDPKIRRIDIHHHYFPPDLNKENTNTNVGWKTPPENLPWTAEISLRAMDAMRIDFSILSLPALSIGCISDENRLIARRRNEFAAKICGAHPDRFGFFATLPFLDDVEGCLEEISYTFDELHAYGVSISSCYGEGQSAKYVGDDWYEPIWEELDKRKAVVFLHGSQVPSSTPYPHPLLGIPVTEVPNETFKAAAHLVVTGRKRQYPNIKIILAHLGGSAPFLSSRIAVLSHYMGCSLKPEEIMDDFKTFYYETALSASEPTLAAVERLIPNMQILFGSDFPVSKDMVQWYTTNLERYYSEDEVKLQGIMRDNAVGLFLGVKGDHI